MRKSLLGLTGLIVVVIAGLGILLSGKTPAAAAWIDAPAAQQHALLVAQNDGNRDLRVEICLLYTSPSPRDLSTSRMPSSA